MDADQIDFSSLTSKFSSTASTPLAMALIAETLPFFRRGIVMLTIPPHTLTDNCRALHRTVAALGQQEILVLLAGPTAKASARQFVYLD